MSSAATALTAAVYDALAGGGLAVHDHVAADAAWPYVTLGACSERAWGAKDFSGNDFRLTVDCWSDAPGRREAQGLMELVRGALEGGALAVAGHRVVLVMQESSDLVREAETRIFHGLVRFRVLMHRDDV